MSDNNGGWLTAASVAAAEPTEPAAEDEAEEDEMAKTAPPVTTEAAADAAPAAPPPATAAAPKKASETPEAVLARARGFVASGPGRLVERVKAVLSVVDPATGAARVVDAAAWRDTLAALVDTCVFEGAADTPNIEANEPAATALIQRGLAENMQVQTCGYAHLFARPRTYLGRLARPVTGEPGYEHAREADRAVLRRCLVLLEPVLVPHAEDAEHKRVPLLPEECGLALDTVRGKEPVYVAYYGWHDAATGTRYYALTPKPADAYKAAHHAKKPRPWCYESLFTVRATQRGDAFEQHNSIEALLKLERALPNGEHLHLKMDLCIMPTAVFALLTEKMAAPPANGTSDAADTAASAMPASPPPKRKVPEPPLSVRGDEPGSPTQAVKRAYAADAAKTHAAAAAAAATNGSGGETPVCELTPANLTFTMNPRDAVWQSPVTPSTVLALLKARYEMPVYGGRVVAPIERFGTLHDLAYTHEGSAALDSIVSALVFFFPDMFPNVRLQ